MQNICNASKMSTFKVPVRIVVLAKGEVEVEAGSLEEAFDKVRNAIREEGFYSIAGEAEFCANWSEARDLAVDDEDSPSGSLAPKVP